VGPLQRVYRKLQTRPAERLLGMEFLERRQQDIGARNALGQGTCPDQNRLRAGMIAQIIGIKTDKTEKIEKNSKLDVTGNVTEKIDGNTKLTVGGKVSETVTGNVTEDFSGDHSEKIGGDLTQTASGKIEITATTSITLKVGASSIKIDNKGVTIKGTMVNIQGTAMAEMKSPLTTVKASGLLTLKGGLTMIN